MFCKMEKATAFCEFRGVNLCLMSLFELATKHPVTAHRFVIIIEQLALMNFEG